MSAKWTFWAWEVKIKTAPKKLALLQLANNANDDGKSWYAISKMADACGVAERTFQRQIQSLENDGLLQVERRSNRSSIYHLKDEMEITLKDTGDSLTPRGDTVTGQGDFVTPLGVTESHTILTLDPNTTPINDPISVIDQLFEQFWSAGMARVGGKAKTLTRIKAKVKANPKLEIESFLRFLINDVQKRLEAQQYGFDRLHPSRYIKDERYNDDVLANNSTVNNIIEDNDTEWATGMLPNGVLSS